MQIDGVPTRSIARVSVTVLRGTFSFRVSGSTTTRKSALLAGVSEIGDVAPRSLPRAADQIFLGVVGLSDFVRPQVAESITTLNNAGVRFVQFGSGGLAATKSLGARLGIAEELNSCISLQEGATDLDRAYTRAGLPRGVPQIRAHLVLTDRVPLQVSLFSHSSGVAMRSMIGLVFSFPRSGDPPSRHDDTVLR
jgi:hypothetical protein